MDNMRRKKMINDYKRRAVVGGVCCMRCGGNRRLFLQSTRNLDGLRNRFNFAISTGCCPDPTIRAEWEKYGPESFSFSVLEELKKGEDQTNAQYAQDIDTLLELWREKSAAEIEAAL